MFQAIGALFAAIVTLFGVFNRMCNAADKLAQVGELKANGVLTDCQDEQELKRFEAKKRLNDKKLELGFIENKVEKA